MSLFLDIFLLAIMVWCIVYGNKHGFFKSVMNLASGIISLLVSYTFTPALSAFLKEKVFLGAISEGITDTFASAAKVTVDEAGEAVYDFAHMLENPQITDVAERYGITEEALTELVEGAGEASYGAIENISATVADSVAGTVSTACAFILIFIIATVVLKIFTSIIGGIFKLPVLKTMDRTLGTVFGVVAAVFFGWVISVALDAALPALVTVAPGVITESTYANTILVRFFSSGSFLDIFQSLQLS